MSNVVRAEALCGECGAVLRSHWTEDGQDWLPWQDNEGSVIGGRVETWEQYLARLRETDVAEYSVQSAARALGASLMPGEHLHYPDTLAGAQNGIQVPECCGWPMRAARDEWVCRKCDERHTFPGLTAVQGRVYSKHEHHQGGQDEHLPALQRRGH